MAGDRSGVFFVVRRGSSSCTSSTNLSLCVKRGALPLAIGIYILLVVFVG